MSRPSEADDEPGYLLGGTIIGLWFSLAFVASILEPSSACPSPEGPSSILAGIDLYMADAVFLLSYYNRTKSFLFRWIMWVCENFSFPRSARMAFFYAGLSFFLGTVSLLQGFGLWRP